MTPNYLYPGMKNLKCDNCGVEFSIPIKDIICECPSCDIIGIAHEVDAGDILYKTEKAMLDNDLVSMIWTCAFDYETPGYMGGEYFDV